MEELLNLIPLERGVNLLISKLPEGLEIEASLAKGDHPYLGTEHIKADLSYNILQGLCDSIEETTDDRGETVIRLLIRQNSI